MLKNRLFVIGLLVIGLWLLLLGLLAFAVYPLYQTQAAKQAPIKVGVLHALSGTMQLSEAPVAQMTLLAIDEINAQGGILGRPIQAILQDTQSNPRTAAIHAEKLIKEQDVSALFGCWTSSCRKAVKPIVEAYDHLLLYPVQYEGIETSNSIVYLGQTLNQQIKPTLHWASQQLCNRFFLVGNDYIYPRMANQYIHDIATTLNSVVVGEHYVPLSTNHASDFAPIINALKKVKQAAKNASKAQSIVILNTLNGDSNVAFFSALHQAGFAADNTTVISFSLSDSEVSAIAAQAGAEAIAGHYLASSYFTDVIHSNNRQIKNRLAQQQITTVPNAAMVNAYSAVWFYKQAVEACGSFDPHFYKPCLAYQSYASPAGILSLTKGNLNTWQPSRIGQLNRSLHYDIVWDSATPIQPENTPHTRTDQAWQALLLRFYEQWHQQWQAPDAQP
jgi:urea transport system substrate-binding protein